jgi:DNA-binding protein YbaB
VTTPGDDRARLEARNAAMKNQVDELLEQFQRQTEQLQEAQAQASAASATLMSQDGLVTVSVDSAGTLTVLRFAPNTFERTKPETLAKTVQDLIHRATLQVKSQVAELMRPLTEDLPDLPDFIEGAPSLAGLVPDIPDYTEPEPEPEQKRAESYEDPAAGSIMRRAQDAPTKITPPVPPAPKPLPRRVRPTDDDEEEPPDSWLTRGR